MVTWLEIRDLTVRRGMKLEKGRATLRCGFICKLHEQIWNR